MSICQTFHMNIYLKDNLRVEYLV